MDQYELQLHVNSAHLDFLTPESDHMQYLEDPEQQGDWGSLWELDRCAGEAGLAAAVADSPEVAERKVDTRAAENPFVESDVSDTEEDTTVCSVLETEHSLQSGPSPRPLHRSPKRARCSGSSGSPATSSMVR